MSGLVSFMAYEAGYVQWLVEHGFRPGAVAVRAEERALIDGLGERYRHFAASRARLVPGIW